MAANSRVKEIITFQVGNYSNFVGAHFWNFQEALLTDANTVQGNTNELQHGTLFRQGVNFQTGQTSCKPRVITFDLKDNIRNFSQRIEPLAEDIDNVTVWEGTVEKYDRGFENSKNPRTNIEVNTEIPETSISNSMNNHLTELYNEDTVLTWSDFSLSRFHDKSLQSIESLHSDGCVGFDNFGSGEMMFQTRKFHDEFEDRLHFFAEECDKLQGFQIFTDINDGFAGLTSSILLELADDYAKKGRLCFAMTPVAFEDTTRHVLDQEMLNTLLSFGRFVDAGFQVVPVSLRDSYELRHGMVEFPSIYYKGNLNYHTSSILASAIDTTTLPYRLADSQSTDMNALVNHLSSAGRKISALSIGLPIPVSSTATLSDLLKEDRMKFVTSVTPDIDSPENILTQSTVIRGIPAHLLKPEDYQHTTRQLSAVFQYESSLGYTCPTYIAQSPCMVTPPFPNIFKPSVTQVGCVITDYQRPKELRVQRTSVMTSLQNSEAIARSLEVVLQRTDKVNVMKYPGFLEAGIEQADVESCREDVKTLAQAYQSGYQL